MSETSVPAPPETYAGEGMYVRKATGLVRDISPLSATIFNILPTAPGVGLAVSVFWVLAVLPGAHIISAYWLTGLIALAIAACVGFLTMTMPRSGGDYILVSRSLGPPLGLASSASLMLVQILAAALFSYYFVVVGLIPGFAVIGLLSGREWWTDVSTTLSGQGWTFALTLAMVLIGAFLASLPVRRAFRIQNITLAVAMLGLLVGIISMFAISNSSFESAFNDLAGSGSYAQVIETAAVPAPGTSWANTFPAVGALTLFFCFSWWSAQYGGEIRQSRTWKTVGSMTGSVLIYTVIYTIGTVALFHMAGDKFVAAANALNGTEDYPLAVAPYWHVLLAIGTKSTVLAIFLVVTFLFWFPAWVWLQFAQPIRAMFAWSFDGLLPRQVAYVHPRTATPVVAIGISTLLGIGAAIWVVYGTNFFTALATITLLVTAPLGLLCLSALALPYLRPDIWRRSPLPIKIAGVPLLSWIGLAGTAATGVIVYALLKYPELGIANRGKTLLIMAGFIVGPFIYYYAAREVQRRKNGVDIGLNYAEIPPE